MQKLKKKHFYYTFWPNSFSTQIMTGPASYVLFLSGLHLTEIPLQILSQ